MQTKKAHLEITTTAPIMLKVFLENNFVKLLTFKIELDPNYIQPKPDEIGRVMFRCYIYFSKHINDRASMAFVLGMNWQTEKNKYNYSE